MQQYEFSKVNVPTSKEEKMELLKKLRIYNISLTQYESTLKQKGIE